MEQTEAEDNVQDSEHSEPSDHQSGDTEEADTRQEQVTPPIPVRRSDRTRRKPQWMQGGEYVLSAQIDWLIRVNCLSSLLDKGLMPGRSQAVIDIILDLASGKIK